jgi:hypothetical protein
MGFFGFGKKKNKQAKQGGNNREAESSKKADTTFLVFGADEAKPAIVVKAKPPPSARPISHAEQPVLGGTNYNDRKSVGAALAASAANVVQLRKSQKVTKPIETVSDDEKHSDSDSESTNASDAKKAESVEGEGRRVPIASARLAVTSLANRPTVPRGARRAPTMSRQFQGNTAKGLLANVSPEDLAYAKKKAGEAKAKAEARKNSDASSSNGDGEADKNGASDAEKPSEAESGEGKEKKEKVLADTSPLRMNLTLDRKRAERKKSNGNVVHPLSVRIKAGYEFFERDGVTYRVRSGWRKSLSRSTTFDGYGVYLMKTERDWELVRDPALKADLLTELRAVRPGRSSSAGRLSLHYRKNSGASSSTIRDRASRKLSGSVLRSDSIAAEAEAAYRARMQSKDKPHTRSKTAGAVMSRGPDGETVEDNIISFDDDNDTDDGTDDGAVDGGSKSSGLSEASKVTTTSIPVEKEASVPALLKESDNELRDEAPSKTKTTKAKPSTKGGAGESESSVLSVQKKKKKKKKKKTTTTVNEVEGMSEPTTKPKKKKKKKKKTSTKKETTRSRVESSGSVESGDWVVTVKSTAPEPQSWAGGPPDLIDMKRRKSVRDLAAMFDN